MIVGRHAWQQEEEQKGDISTSQIFQEEFFIFRALQKHSRRDLIDPSLQDNVTIQNRIFQHIYHLKCAFNLHSIIKWIDIWRSEFKQETDSIFCPLIPEEKSIKILKRLTGIYHVVHNTCIVLGKKKKHQEAVFWVDIDLSIRKGLTFYQTRSNAIIFQKNTSSLLCSKSCEIENWKVLYEKSYMSPRPQPKISSRHDHDWTRGKVSLGSTVDQQPEGKVVRQSRGEVQHATFSQLTQPIPKPIRDRSGQPEDMQDVFVVKGATSRSHEINENRFTKNFVLQIHQDNVRWRLAWWSS